MLSKTSTLSPKERQWISTFLNGKPWFQFYWTCSLSDLKRGMDNRSYLIPKSRNGLIMALHFDDSDVFTTVGDIAEEELSTILSFRNRGEVHLETIHENCFKNIAKNRIRREDRICYYRMQSSDIKERVDSRCRKITEEQHGEVLSFFHKNYPETNVSKWMFSLPFVGLWERNELLAVAGTMVREESSCHIGNFLTRPDMRGRGLGKAVAKALISILTCKGVRTFMLGVFEQNSAARRLYEKVGFQMLESRPMVYLNEEDVGRDPHPID